MTSEQNRALAGKLLDLSIVTNMEYIYLLVIPDYGSVLNNYKFLSDDYEWFEDDRVA